MVVLQRRIVSLGVGEVAESDRRPYASVVLDVGVGCQRGRSPVLKLHQPTAGTGVYAAHVPIFAWIGTGGPETQPDTIAQHYWDLYTKRDGADHTYAAA